MKPLYVIKDPVLRRDLTKIFVMGSMGGILQLSCKYYIKRHPEQFNRFNRLVENLKKIDPDTLTPDQRYTYYRLMKALEKGRYKFELFRQLLSLRGGVIPALSPLAAAAMEWFATYGFVATFMTTLTATFYKKVSTEIADSLMNGGKKLFAKLRNKPESMESKIKNIKLEYLKQCPPDLDYMYKMIGQENINPQIRDFEIKKAIKNYYDLDTYQGNPMTTESRKVIFILCMIGIITSLAAKNPDSAYSLMERFFKAVRELRIQKSVLRAIFRKLKKAGLPISPELDEILEKDFAK